MAANDQIQTIYADFNNRVGGSLRLSCDGTKADLLRLSISLRDGLRLHVTDGDLAADGVVRWSSELDDWVIDFDMSKVIDLHETDGSDGLSRT
jgi:hypothetical protein